MTESPLPSIGEGVLFEPTVPKQLFGDKKVKVRGQDSLGRRIGLFWIEIAWTAKFFGRQRSAAPLIFTELATLTRSGRHGGMALGQTNHRSTRLCGMPRSVAALRRHILFLSARHFRWLQVLGTTRTSKACLCPIVFGGAISFTFWWVRFHYSQFPDGLAPERGRSHHCRSRRAPRIASIASSRRASDSHELTIERYSLRSRSWRAAGAVRRPLCRFIAIALGTVHGHLPASHGEDALIEQLQSVQNCSAGQVFWPQKGHPWSHSSVGLRGRPHRSLTSVQRLRVRPDFRTNTRSVSITFASQCISKQIPSTK